jgi:hypothetical protein
MISSGQFVSLIKRKKTYLLLAFQAPAASYLRVQVRAWVLISGNNKPLVDLISQILLYKFQFRLAE